MNAQRITYARISDDEWGIRGPVAVVRPGAVVVAVRASGQRQAVRVGRIVREFRDNVIATFAAVAGATPEDVDAEEHAVAEQRDIPFGLVPVERVRALEAEVARLRADHAATLDKLEETTREVDTGILQTKLDRAIEAETQATHRERLAQQALDAARAKLKAAGFESLDALIEAARRPSLAADPKLVAGYAAEAARKAVLEALARRPERADAPVPAYHATTLEERVRPVDLDPAEPPAALKDQEVPHVTATAARGDSPRPAGEGDAKPERKDSPATGAGDVKPETTPAPVAPTPAAPGVLPGGVRARLAARKAAREGGAQ